jgi:hypothetical protein
MVCHNSGRNQLFLTRVLETVFCNETCNITSFIQHSSHVDLGDIVSVNSRAVD